MEAELRTLRENERLTLKLRTLYERCGYARFSMNRLEEYAFYVENMAYIDKGEMIVFSDLDGRLMALKPDITMSIVKSVDAGERTLERLYYTENVFRAAKRTREFREIRQLGLEAIGDVTRYALTEVVSLATRSLMAIDESWVLDISHIDYITALLDSLKLDYAQRGGLLSCMRQKNAHDAGRLLSSAGISAKDAESVLRLITLPGDFPSALKALGELVCSDIMEKAVEELSGIYDALGLDSIRFDPSLIPDSEYYNGVAFAGYVSRAPDPVLKGGCYDKLLSRMGKTGRAIGFALYFDDIERYYCAGSHEAPKTLLLYDESVPVREVCRSVQALTDAGESVTANRVAPDGARFTRIIDLRKGDGANA